MEDQARRFTEMFQATTTRYRAEFRERDGRVAVLQCATVAPSEVSAREKPDGAESQQTPSNNGR